MSIDRTSPGSHLGFNAALPEQNPETLPSGELSLTRHPDHRCSPLSFCGEFLCDRCGRIRPWCRGVGTDFEDMCDECYYALQRIQEEI